MIDKIKAMKRDPQSGITKFNTVDLAYNLFQEENGLDDENKSADTIILFIAGHETTGNLTSLYISNVLATALTWTMYLLAKHPGIQEKLRNEVEEVFKGREVVHEDLKKVMVSKVSI
jgi:cytochrome P450